jgi:hypothetical protein
VVELAAHHALERLHGVLQLHVLARRARELLGHEEGLRQEALDAARPAHDHLVLFGQLVHPQDGDDVLQLLVALQDALHRGGRAVVPLADVLRVQDAAGGVERVHGRVDAQLRDRAREHRGGVEVRERPWPAPGR